LCVTLYLVKLEYGNIFHIWELVLSVSMVPHLTCLHANMHAEFYSIVLAL